MRWQRKMEATTSGMIIMVYANRERWLKDALDTFSLLLSCPERRKVL